MSRYLQDGFVEVLPNLAMGLPPDSGKPRHRITLDIGVRWLTDIRDELQELQAALGVLEDRLAEAQQKEEEKRAPGVREAAARQLPTLWGHIRRLPGWVATAADFITVGGFLLAAATKLAGLW